MPNENLEKILILFPIESRARPDLGKKIIRKHGGDISVVSKVAPQFIRD